MIVENPPNENISFFVSLAKHELLLTPIPVVHFEMKVYQVIPGLVFGVTQINSLENIVVLEGLDNCRDEDSVGGFLVVVVACVIVELKVLEGSIGPLERPCDRQQSVGVSIGQGQSM